MLECTRIFIFFLFLSFFKIYSVLYLFEQIFQQLFCWTCRRNTLSVQTRNFTIHQRIKTDIRKLLQINTGISRPELHQLFLLLRFRIMPVLERGRNVDFRGVGSFRMQAYHGILLARLKTSLKHYKKWVEKRKKIFFGFFNGFPGKIVVLSQRGQKSREMGQFREFFVRNKFCFYAQKKQ